MKGRSLKTLEEVQIAGYSKFHLFEPQFFVQAGLAEILSNLIQD